MIRRVIRLRASTPAFYTPAPRPLFTALRRGPARPSTDTRKVPLILGWRSDVFLWQTRLLIALIRVHKGVYGTPDSSESSCACLDISLRASRKARSPAAVSDGHEGLCAPDEFIACIATF